LCGLTVASTPEDSNSRGGGEGGADSGQFLFFLLYTALKTNMKKKGKGREMCPLFVFMSSIDYNQYRLGEEKKGGGERKRKEQRIGRTLGAAR